MSYFTYFLHALEHFKSNKITIMLFAISIVNSRLKLTKREIEALGSDSPLPNAKMAFQNLKELEHVVL